MTLPRIAWRSIRQRSLSSTLTGVSMALGVTLVVAVLVVYSTVNSSFNRAAEGYNLVIGGKGSALTLVMSTVYFVGTPIEPIPWSYYTEFLSTPEKQGRFAPYVEIAIPYCLGDNYQGYRVVGTTNELFTHLGLGIDDDGNPIPYAFAQGRNFHADAFMEAVVGAEAARKTGLAVGSRFQPTHGLSDEGAGHKHDAFTVVGVLAPTGTPNDRALFINIEGFFLLEDHAKPLDEAQRREEMLGLRPKADADRAATAGRGPDEDEHAHEDEHEHAHEHEEDHQHAEAHEDEDDDEDEHEVEDHAHEHDHDHADEHAHEHDHEHHHHEPLPPEQREVTAILVRTRLDNPTAGMALKPAINEEPVATAAAPLEEISRLLDVFVNPTRWLLLGLTGLIVVVAGIGIMVSIYNSMSERRREIAVMRALGARRATVMAIVLWESVLLSLAGGVAGVLLGHVLIAALNPVIVSLSGVSIGLLQWGTFRLDLPGGGIDVAYELVLVPALVVLASLVGLLPAASAYRTDVSGALAATP